MKKISYLSLGYIIFGLLVGVFYREFPKFISTPEAVAESQLSVVHTHTLTLGTFFFLFVLIFAKLFHIDSHVKSIILCKIVDNVMNAGCSIIQQSNEALIMSFGLLVL